MRSKNKPDVPASFIETARRAQIIECAIDVIAELGYAQASLAQIASRAAIAKGVISYYFDGKDDLIRHVAGAVATSGWAFIEPRVQAQESARGKLQAYIESSIAFIRTNPTKLAALIEILTNFRTKDGKLQIDLKAGEPLLAGLETVLLAGQENGEFRGDFTIRVMAVTIQGSINGVLGQWVAYADFDLEACGRELFNTFDLATRS